MPLLVVADVELVLSECCKLEAMFVALRNCFVVLLGRLSVFVNASRDMTFLLMRDDNDFTGQCRFTGVECEDPEDSTFEALLGFKRPIFRKLSFETGSGEGVAASSMGMRLLLADKEDFSGACRFRALS